MAFILRKTCAGNINLFLVMVPKRYVPLSNHSYRSRLPYSFRWRSARSVESRGSRSHRNSVSLAGSPTLSCVRAVAIIESRNDDLTIIIATIIMKEYQNPWQAEVKMMIWPSSSPPLSWESIKIHGRLLRLWLQRDTFIVEQVKSWSLWVWIFFFMKQ